MEMLKLTPFIADYIWGGSRIVDEYGIESVDMVNEDCSFYKTLYRNK